MPPSFLGDISLFSVISWIFALSIPASTMTACGNGETKETEKTNLFSRHLIDYGKLN